MTVFELDPNSQAMLLKQHYQYTHAIDFRFNCFPLYSEIPYSQDISILIKREREGEDITTSITEHLELHTSDD